MLRPTLLLALAMLAACSKPPAGSGDQAIDAAVEKRGTPAPAPSAIAPAVTSYVGRWRGVEGMFLDVQAKPAGGLRIENQWDLDHKGSFDGTAQADGLHWTRNGKVVIARASDGDATGLKYLAGKRDCLTVDKGEGYCRD